MSNLNLIQCFKQLITFQFLLSRSSNQTASTIRRLGFIESKSATVNRYKIKLETVIKQLFKSAVGITTKKKSQKPKIGSNFTWNKTMTDGTE